MEIDLKEATFIRRLVAFALDGMLLSSLTAIIMRINPELLLVVSCLYFVLFDASKHQGTIGKQLVGIKVVNNKGEKLSLIHAAIRHFVKYFGILFLGIGYLGMFFTTTKKKSLVDKLTYTQVIMS